MRLTDEQIAETVERMRMPEKIKAALMRQAKEGVEGARFVIYAHWKRNQK